MARSRSVIATPPGETIKEQLEDREMTQKDFAARMGMSEKHISRLINGEVHLTAEVAVRLEMVLGIPAKYWNNLEAIYREKLEKVKLENEMEADMKIVKRFPYAEMAKNEWVPTTNKSTERVVNMRKFFEVVNLSLIDSPKITQIAWRRLSKSEKNDYALMAWAQKAKIDARNIETAAINIERLENSVPEIRAMNNDNPEDFCPRLREILAQCGVAIVFLPHIGGSFLHGATFYDGKKIVIGLTVRGKDADRFWFSLFHEIAHVLLGHIGQSEGVSDEDEACADDFARDTLIKPSDFDTFVNERDFSKEAICGFSKRVNIAAGIVVGRLQKEGLIKYSFCNDLKRKYIIT